MTDKRVQESIWITSSILKSALSRSKGSGPRASIVITQADSYADTIRMCGGARGVLAKYLPHVSNSYDWLDIFDVTAVDKTVMDDDGNIVPARDFKPVGLRVLMNWILNLKEESSPKKTEPQKKKVVIKSSAFRKNTIPDEIICPDEDIKGSLAFALIVIGLSALVCFGSKHWIIGIVQTLLFFITIGVREDKVWHQGVRWFWYTLIVLVGGIMGCNGHWEVMIIADWIGIRLIQRRKERLSIHEKTEPRRRV